MLSPGGARFVVPGTAHASQRRSIRPCHPLTGTPAKSSETGDPQPNLKPGTTKRAPKNGAKLTTKSYTWSPFDPFPAIGQPAAG